MKATSTGRRVGDAALGWSQRLEVEVGGARTVAQAGVVLPRLLADRLGLTTGLADVVARAGFVPVRRRRVEYSIGWPVDERTLSGSTNCARATGARRSTPTARPTPPRRRLT